MKQQFLVSCVAVLILISADASTESPAQVSKLKISTLSTMLTEFRGVGEWGYAALIEVDGHTFLFDTGARPDTVLKNAAELGVHLSGIDTVILSHNHWDHTGGLTTLRKTFRDQNPEAMSTTHVGEGIFLPRVASGPASNPLWINVLDVREEYESLGGKFVVHAAPHELFPGVWLTGPIPRVHPEKNYPPISKIETADGLVDDTIPEDQALVINTAEGLVVVTGCGHAGIVNTMEYARAITNGSSVHAVIGGLHLFQADDDHLAWTGAKMKEFGVQHMIGAHCTGIEAAFRLRDSAGLTRPTAVVGAVGSTFTLGTGINPGVLAR